MLAFCEQCGTDLRNEQDARFCPTCGTRLEIGFPSPPSGPATFVAHHGQGRAMGFAEANRVVFLEKYATFTGRASPSEFWWPGLTFPLALVFVAVLFSMTAGYGETSSLGAMFAFLILGMVVAAAIPLIAVTVRRLHDTGRSGWWYLTSFLPFGGFILLALVLMGATPGPNQYGPGPGQS